MSRYLSKNIWNIFTGILYSIFRFIYVLYIILQHIYENIIHCSKCLYTLFDAFYDDNSSNNWSFAETDDDLNILKTAEKHKISNWCSTGLYVFRSIWLYIDAYENAISDDTYNFYIAPLYNYLKGMKNKVLICPNDDVDFAGIPEQYNNVVEKYKNIDIKLI